MGDAANPIVWHGKIRNGHAMVCAERVERVTEVPLATTIVDAEQTS